MHRILIIDDDPQMRGFVSELLTRNGYEILEAVDGVDGIKTLEQTTVDLVITDLIMPEKEGSETIAEVRQRWPQIRIIAMSGGSRTGHDFLPIARALGARRVLYKPIPSETLLTAVRDVLNTVITLLASIPPVIAA